MCGMARTMILQLSDMLVNVRNMDKALCSPGRAHSPPAGSRPASHAALRMPVRREPHLSLRLPPAAHPAAAPDARRGLAPPSAHQSMPPRDTAAAPMSTKGGTRVQLSMLAYMLS